MIYKENSVKKISLFPFMSFMLKFYILGILFFFIVNIINLINIPEVFYNETQKKTLYLHVGPHKTGSSIIQLECTKNRNMLKLNKVLYLVSLTSFFEKDNSGWINHSDIAWMLKKGNLGLVKIYIFLIKILATNYNAILLSSEDFSPSILMSFNQLNCDFNSVKFENFTNFLDVLRQNFNLKILFCHRNFADRIASASTMLSITAPEAILSYGTLDSYLLHTKRKDDEIENYFRKIGAKFLSYEKLKKSGRFVHSFLKEGLNIEINIQDNQINQSGNYTIPHAQFSEKLLNDLEDFYSPVSKHLFNGLKKDHKDFINLAKKLGEIVKVRTYELFPGLKKDELS